MKFVLPAWTMGRNPWMKEEKKILDGIEAKAKEENAGCGNPFTGFYSD